MTTTPAATASLATAMFSVSDQDAAIAFYTGPLGWEVRADTSFGPAGEYRWVEVAPHGSVARLALNLPMGGSAGGGSVGVEVADVHTEHARLKALGDVDVDAELMQAPDVPTMFAVRDADGNAVWIVAAP